MADDTLFSWMPAIDGDDRETLLLASSIRKWGGKFSGSSIRILLPENGSGFNPRVRKELALLGAEIVLFELPQDGLTFPYAAKVFAAARAEELAEGEAACLAWLDPDTLVIRPPAAFSLPPGIDLGYRPVMLKNISSPMDEPPDPFWRLLYEACGTPDERLFPMFTTVDGVPIRPNINAGMLVVRPETGLLRGWRRRFEALYRDPVFETYFQKSALYKIFLHQSVLAAGLPADLEPQKILDFGAGYNEPVFLNERYPAGKHIAHGEAITLRYDEVPFFEQADWQKKMCLDPGLINWLVIQLSRMSSGMI